MKGPAEFLWIGPILLQFLLLASLAGCAGSGNLAGDVTLMDPSDESVTFGPSDSVYVDPSYRLGPGDTIRMVFLFDHDLDDEIIVRPDGAINLPILGDIMVAGTTPGQLADTVRTAYSRYYTNPQLSINLKEFAKPKVYILGDVKYPKAVDIRPGMTVAGALAEAGGPTEFADLRHAVLVRRMARNQAMARRFDLLRFTEGRPMSSDLYLQDYDIIFVPRTFIGKLVTVVNDIFGKMVALPIFYLRGWEAFNTDLVYNREIRPSEIPSAGSNAGPRGAN
ncbi:MAG: polysaccharide biosynthesis/export family protein [Candidatus Eisenbacteria bacterium]|nr:polysaccharide biosynthesis/export family protein [Candidatus Eisenbacteria bacterium]